MLVVAFLPFTTHFSSIPTRSPAFPLLLLIQKMISRISVMTLALLVTFAGIGHSAPLDVYSPPLLTPAAGEVWQVGTRQKVTW